MPKNQNKQNNSRKNTKRRAKPVMDKMYASMPTRVHRQRLVFGTNVNATEAAAGSGVYLTYRLNSPWDPDTTVLSTATPGFATFATLFNRYRVHSVDIEYNGYVASSGFFYAQTTVLPCAFQPVIPSNPQAWPTQRLSATKRASLISVSASGGASVPVCIKKHYSLNDIVDCTRAQYLADLDYTGLTNNNPTKIVFMALCTAGVGSSVLTMSGYLKISYDIEFLDPFPLTI